VGIAATEWPSVLKTCNRLGWRFDGWQDGAGKLIVSKRADGSYAADTIVISIPRQVGKTYLVACIIFALCLLHPNLKVIWTAHRKTTSAETFREFDGMAQRPKVAAHIAQIYRGKGDERIVFKNGSTIEFGARESGFGRGRTDVDVLVFDEGQILSNDALENMGATQNVAANPLTFVMGTPPRPRDDGEFFTLLRQEALDGESDGTLYIEMSADRGADPMDRKQWRKANASYPHRTTERAMLRLRKKLKSDDSWNREALGIWDEFAANRRVISAPKWAALSDLGPADGVKPKALGVDASHGREFSIAACWQGEDRYHAEEVWAGADEMAAENWIAAHTNRLMPIVIDGLSPAASLVPRLRARGLNVKVTTSTDMIKACGLWFSDVSAARMTHADQESVNEAVNAGRKRPIGSSGGWGWDRKDGQSNIAPLVAHTLARYGASLTRRAPHDRSKAERRAVVA
jgi:hypothetical protein